MLRIALAEVLGVGEGPTGEHSVGVTRPAQPSLVDPHRPREPEHVKWLEAAPHLELVPLTGVSEDDQLRASGYDVDRLRAEARRLAGVTD
ncbi:hypothetical protein V5H98_15035 [Georgenia sp. M64]|uniref:hypothetical protein n=1 Tax=Georgenia sp. M64 TaxID=3120520 RepID=UPI0030E13762